MSLLRSLHCNFNYSSIIRRCMTKSVPEDTKFETVFSFPYAKYFALINRLKVYHMVGSSVMIPGSGILETLSVVPDYTFFTVSYVGLTSLAVLSLFSIPFKNVIGFIYISEDNKLIKISSVDFWGKRKDKIIDVEDWTPLNDIPTRTVHAFYLTPEVADGTKYKMFTKFGHVLNAQKVGQILE